MRPSTLHLSLAMCFAACATTGCSPPAAPQPEKPPAPQATAAVQAAADQNKQIEAATQ